MHKIIHRKIPTIRGWGSDDHEVNIPTKEEEDFIRLCLRWFYINRTKKRIKKKIFKHLISLYLMAVDMPSTPVMRATEFMLSIHADLHASTDYHYKILDYLEDGEYYKAKAML